MTSYEIIGSIAVVHDEKTAKQVMKQNKNVKTVAVRAGEVKGQYRIKKVKIILGEKTTETTHKENNVLIKVDINKVYYSPRLQTERQRVVNLVKPNEVVIDMFAGAGPFSIAIAKNTKAKIIYAIDHNPEAVKYLKENIKINKVNNVTAIQGNAIEVMRSLPKANRIIMNAPRQNNEETLKAAKSKLKKRGVIHYYITSNALPINMQGLKIINQRIVTRYAPGKNHVCLDLTT